jgi:hypothetical protein
METQNKIDILNKLFSEDRKKWFSFKELELNKKYLINSYQKENQKNFKSSGFKEVIVINFDDDKQITFPDWVTKLSNEILDSLIGLNFVYKGKDDNNRHLISFV